MSTLKAIREVRRKAKAMGVTTFEAQSVVGHVHLTVTHADGRIQRLVMGSSPRNEARSIMLTVSSIKRFKESHDAPSSS